MKTISINLYSFNELSEAVKTKVLDNFRNDIYNNGDLLTYFKEDIENQLKEEGFILPEVQYSLSNSQGDGLSFSAKRYDKLEALFNEVLGKGKEKTAQIIADHCAVEIKGNNGRYCFASKSDVDLYIDESKDCKNVDLIVKKALDLLECKYMDLCRLFEKQGYEQIEYETSDEAIIETLQANDYTFEENGKIRFI